MSRVYVNNFSTTTAADITDIGTTLVITSATGLPTLSGSEYYYLTLDNLLGTVEIVKVTARTGTSLTIVRAQEGTTGVAWLTGSVIEMRETAESYTPGAIISGKTLTTATVATDDKVLIQDTSDSNNLKTVTAQSIADLAGASVNTFGTIAVAGQSDIVADSSTDTLTIVAGSNITLTTNAGTDTLTIAASGGSGRDRDAKTDISTSGGTTTLTSSSTFQQRWTGTTAGDIVKMPVTSTLSQGYQYLFINDASVSVAVQSSGANAILSIPAGSAVLMTCIDTTVTTAAGWTYTQFGKLGGVFYSMQTVTGNTTLTASSPFITYYEDSGAVNNTMPVAARLVNGQSWLWVNNKSSGDLNIYASDNATLLLTIPIGYKAEFTCKDNAGGTGAGPWIWELQPISIKGNKPIVQTVFTTTGTMATGSTTMPLDNTTPQNTEGDEYMSLAITPTNSNNILDIEVGAFFSNSASEGSSFALFQDSTANCLKSGIIGAIVIAPVVLRHRMTAGTTSSTTFKFRIGRSSAGTITFNGFGSASYMNGTLSSYIKITEYKV